MTKLSHCICTWSQSKEGCTVLEQTNLLGKYDEQRAENIPVKSVLSSCECRYPLNNAFSSETVNVEPVDIMEWFVVSNGCIGCGAFASSLYTSMNHNPYVMNADTIALFS